MLVDQNIAFMGDISTVISNEKAFSIIFEQDILSVEGMADAITGIFPGYFSNMSFKKCYELYNVGF